MFEQVFEGIYLLKVPFANAWTGVVLVDGNEKVLIDTGSRLDDVNEYIIPALEKLGYQLQDIKYLTNTHSHGDHIGGYYRVKELHPNIKVVASESDYKNVEDPASLAIKIRTKFPAYSPAPQSYLKGIKVDKILKDGEKLNDRLIVYETPGHDLGCVCWYDTLTKTIITGDSLQGNGTGTQGVAFYQDLACYKASLEKLLTLDIENIICGHDYDQIGSVIKGKEKVKETLNYCLSVLDKYQAYIDNKMNEGNNDAHEIAVSMINDIGCGMPPMLFMSIYTVTQHMSLHK